MHTAPFRAQALAGGYDLDPDLPPPEDHPQDSLAGLHVLRHLTRFLDSLRMELVLTGEWSLEHHLSGDYPEQPAEREWRRYRQATEPSTILELVEAEPQCVPVLYMRGSRCVGWSEVSWEGVPLARHLQPGRLFALAPSWSVFGPYRPGAPVHLHLLAWQAPFPTHSLVSWTNEAALCDGPQPLPEALQVAAGRMFHTGTNIRDEGRW